MSSLHSEQFRNHPLWSGLPKNIICFSSTNISDLYAWFWLIVKLFNELILFLANQMIKTDQCEHPRSQNFPRFFYRKPSFAANRDWFAARFIITVIGLKSASVLVSWKPSRTLEYWSFLKIRLNFSGPSNRERFLPLGKQHCRSSCLLVSSAKLHRWPFYVCPYTKTISSST